MIGIGPWLRWYVDTVADPKFRVVASRAGCPTAHVIAVWALLLEKAAASETRGTIDSWDHDVAGMALDVPGAAVGDIIACMQGLLLDGLRIKKWGKRQPKREDDSTDRVRNFRARKARAADRETGGNDDPDGSNGGNDGNGGTGNETHGNVSKRSETHGNARGDKRREEETVTRFARNEPPSVSADAEPAAVSRPLVEVLFGECLAYLTSNGVKDNHARSLLGKWRKQYGDGETAAAIAEAQRGGASDPVPMVTAILDRRALTKARDSPRHPYAPAASASAMMRLFAEQEATHATDVDRGYSPRDDDAAARLLPPAQPH
jgi:hypothetical protein